MHQPQYAMPLTCLERSDCPCARGVAVLSTYIAGLPPHVAFSSSSTYNPLPSAKANPISLPLQTTLTSLSSSTTRCMHPASILTCSSNTYLAKCLPPLPASPPSSSQSQLSTHAVNLASAAASASPAPALSCKCFNIKSIMSERAVRSGAGGSF